MELICAGAKSYRLKTTARVRAQCNAEPRDKSYIQEERLPLSWRSPFEERVKRRGNGLCVCPSSKECHARFRGGLLEHGQVPKDPLMLNDEGFFAPCCGKLLAASAAPSFE